MLDDFIPKEWLIDYFNRGKVDGITIRNPVVTEFGFLTFDVIDNTLFVYDCYGDGKRWDDLLCTVAKKLGLKEISFITRRNPKAFKRLFGYELVKIVKDNEGNKLYLMSKKVG